MKDATVFEYKNWSRPNDDMARNQMLVKLINDAEVLVPSVATVGLHSGGLNGLNYLYLFSVRPHSHIKQLPSWIDGPTQASYGDILFVFGFSEGMLQFFRDAGLQLYYIYGNIAVSKGVMKM